MGEYHLIGKPIDPTSCPAVFELRLHDFLPCINPETFNLPADTQALCPAAYFITSGDALAKAIKLEKDLWKLAVQLRTRYANLETVKTTNGAKKTWVFEPKHKKYVQTVWKCAGQCRAMVNRLCEAKGVNCFLETEWREQHLIVIPKNPRSKAKNDSQ